MSGTIGNHVRSSGTAAFSTIDQKVGKKGQAQPRRIPDVETQPCPAGGTHVLTNNAQAETSCVGCGGSWADLDAVVRAARTEKPEFA